MHIDANRKLVGPKNIFFQSNTQTILEKVTKIKCLQVFLVFYLLHSFSDPIVFFYCFHFIFSPKFSKLVDPRHYKENNWLDHAISVKLSTESLLIRKHLSVKEFCYFLDGYFTTDHIDNMRLWRIWSRNHLIPGLLVPHFLSPRRNDPNKIDPPWPTVSIKFGPSGQMVSNQFGSRIYRSP